MSNWTHVAAIVRIDAFRGKLNEIDFTSVFGKTLRWSSPESEWQNADEHPEQYLPMGSEGSLEMTVYEEPDLSHLAAYVVSIFGDLRDHHNPDAIIDWFRERCSKLMVRNACIVADNEISGSRTWTYHDEGGE